MNRKLLSALLALAFSAQTAVSAEHAINFTDIGSDSLPVYSITEHPTGFIPMEDFEVDFEHTEEYIWGDMIPFEPFSAVSAPSAYDAVADNIITTPKNQGKHGVCWAFSLISAMETSMIKKDLENVNEIDYSERHLAYFTHTPNTITGDGVHTYDNEYGYYGGDDPRVGAQYLAGWQGAASEADFPYSPSGTMTNLSEENRYTSVAHLQDYYELEAEDVKSAVMEYGSVVCGYYSDEQYYSLGNAYYQPTSNISNHAVTIVGWDDNYSLENFSSLTDKPSQPGAWKVKNSWGDTWGNGGYFWLSYEEPSLCNFVAVNAESADNYQIIHQYDGAEHLVGYSFEHSANVFTAEQGQTVEAVGFFTMQGNDVSSPISYVADVYRLNDNYTSPVDGTKLSSKQDTLLYTGYHTVELDNHIILNEGDSFSVVLTLKYPSGNNSYHSVEGSSATSNPGESFYFSGNRWYTTGSEYNNVCIKAYSTLEPVTVSFDSNGGNTLASIETQKGSLLKIPSSPEKDGEYFAGWYTDADCTAEWDFKTDTVSGEMTLYAKWSETPIQAESISITGDQAVLAGNTITLSAEIEPYYATDANITWSSSGEGAAVANGVVTGIDYGDYEITAALANGKSATHIVFVRNPIKSVSLSTKSPVYKTTAAIPYIIEEPNAKQFALYIIDQNQQAAIVPNITNKADSFAITVNYPYSEGVYTAYIVAYDYFGNSFVSDHIIFWVTDDPMLIAKQYTKAIHIGAYNGSADSKIILAYYNDSRLETLEIYSTDMLDKLGLVDYDYSYDELKIFWWDSLTGLKPVTAPISLTENNGQIITAQ